MEQTAGSAEVVRREIRIDASPSTVFAFLTDPEKMVRWMGIEAELDPRPGGDYRVRISRYDRVRGEVVEVIPDRRLVFTWGWEGGALPVRPGQSTVEISLERDGEGTLLRLVHRDLPRGMHEFHRLGWETAVGRLGKVAAGEDPGPDPLRSSVHGGRMVMRSLPPRYLFRFARQRLRRS